MQIELKEETKGAAPAGSEKIMLLSYSALGADQARSGRDQNKVLGPLLPLYTALLLQSGCTSCRRI